MENKVNGPAILAKLAARQDITRQKLSFYLSRDLYSEFKKVCNEIPVSQAMEELIREFLRSLKEHKS